MNEEIKLHPAYIAGVLDSDGSLSITIRHKTRPNPSYVACFSLTWTDSEKTINTMNLLKNQYGGYVYFPSPRETSFKNSKPTIKYYLIGKGLKQMIEDILPYIQLKKEQALTILELINTTKFGTYGNGRPKPEELKTFHHSLYIKNKDLNSKNSGDRRIYDGN